MAQETKTVSALKELSFSQLTLQEKESDICLAALHAGVITSLDTSISITCQADLANHVLGTAKNRIVSKAKKRSTRPFRVYKVESTEKVEGVVGELVIVHSGASDDALHFTCLAQDKVSSISTSHLKTWNYKDFKLTKEDSHVSGNNSSQMRFELDTNNNQHAVRIQGSHRDEDIMAVVQYPNAEYQSKVATVRVSIGDSVPIHLLKSREMPSQVYFKHLPGDWTSEPINNFTHHLTPAQPWYTGIYIVHGYTKRRGNTYGAYFDMMVRECKDGQFGIGCSEKCPSCQNGGQCHTRRGSCLCPPGFIGDTCQFACLPGWFGNKCQFRCDQETIGIRGAAKDGRCVGLTICLPPPYGCSCAAGFTHPDVLGPTCTQECSKGHFGADCSQRCLDCVEDKCDPFSGTCTEGCKSGTDCRQGPPSPSATFTPQQRSYTASWEVSDVNAQYFLSHQLVHQLSCGSDNTKIPQIHHEALDVAHYSVSKLLPHASYNVCIVASSSKGLSSPGCSLVTTLSEVPDVNITKLECKETRKLSCYAYVNGNCENHNGPNVKIVFSLHTKLPCPHPNTTLQETVEIKHTRTEVEFPNYLAGVQYQVRAEVVNDAGTGHSFNTTYTTNKKIPPAVQNLTHIILSDSALQLLWNDPCPSNGEITDLHISGPNVYQNLPLESCATTESFDHCHNITGLELGDEYEYKIFEKNDSGWSSSSYKIIFEREPGSPQAIKFISGPRHINLSLELPTYHGGILKNCTIIISHTKKQCKFSLKEKNSPLKCTIDDLEEGKIKLAKAHCCNTGFCGTDLQKLVATKSIPPKLTGPLGIVRKTESTITLHLPAINHSQDGNNSLIVAVQLEDQNKSLNLSSTIQMLVEEHHSATRRRRNTVESVNYCQKQEWVAAELTQHQEEFVVGNGEMHNGFLNCPLKTGQVYSIGTMAVNELLGMRTYSKLVMKSGVRAETTSSSSLFLLLLLLLVLPALGLLAYFRLHVKPASNDWNPKFNPGVSQEVLMQPRETSNVTPNHRLDIEIPDQIKEYDEQDEAIYENLEPEESSATISSMTPIAEVEDYLTKVIDSREVRGHFRYDEQDEAIYENLKPEELSAFILTRTPVAEVEAYLNKVIGSKEAGDDFRTVPSTVTKSMTVAQRPENKGKNRFRNNHPYDDTRVVLPCVHGDPNSDYINANHVQGYGNMRYIAAQGPKDGRVSTIADFFRMVVEQNITVIIMVANFVENGKKKVGEYFIPGQTLNFDGFEVVVNNTEEQSHFTLSSLLVRQGEKMHQLQHYHYSKWPDHGVPTEAISIAQMLSHFQSHHVQGGTVVHCSAGIGRTGTVLQVLLMSEMLTLKGYLNPIEVLGRLRMSRTRLVENEAQYNLSLEILEEILFGKETVVSPDDILNHMDKYISLSRIQYARAKALPSPLSFTSSDMPSFHHLNRNQLVLPADSNRCYLQPRARVNSWLSQYINAIRVPGSNRDQFTMVTEHPLPHTVSNFWRLVIETGCTIVIFINSFENQDENEYPSVLMEPGEIWNVDQYQLQVKETVLYGTWLKYSSLTISSSEDWMHSVTVYQSVEWPVSSPLPPSPYLLLTLAELLQIPRNDTAGPPLLCCSDGVTGCGIVAAMTLIVEHLRSEQVVDVYRTVVKLLRARQQFITSEVRQATVSAGHGAVLHAVYQLCHLPTRICKLWKLSMSTILSPHQVTVMVKLWNSLPASVFPPSCDLNSFKNEVSRCLSFNF
ncbi:uncharacterized protein LOC135102341 isoform X3 [Scylla paramamosain]|uniref:uncharacterized protein LOC135102341 isoform X3 n=1 Tax=Scylla paramamosain TaxID=85552 RepID=UPI003082EBFF